MKNDSIVSKIFYTFIYAFEVVVLILFWLFLSKSFFTNKGFSRVFMIIFSIVFLFGIYIVASRIIKLYNENLGQKMIQKTGIIYHILFAVFWFAVLIYGDYNIIKDWTDGSIVMFIFSLIFYIPGIILIKKVVDLIKNERLK